MAGGSAGGKQVGQVSIRVVPDLDYFRTKLKEGMEAVEKDPSLRPTIGVNLNTAQALTEFKALVASMSNERVKVKVDTEGVSKEVDKAIDGGKPRKVDVEARISERPWTLFRDRMQADLNRVMTTVEPRIPVGIDGDRLRSDVYYKMADLNGRIGSLKLDLDIPESEKAKIIAEIAALEALVPDFSQAGSGSGGVFSALGDIGLRGENLGILLAALAFAAPVISLVSGALVTIPGILTGILAPIGAIALGVDGIKKAAETLKEPFEQLKKTMSERFEEKLTPVFETLRQIFPVLEEEMPKIADGLTAMFAGAVDAITSEEGLGSVRSIIDNIGASLAAAQPGVRDFTSGFLTLADQVVAKFPGLTQGFNELGDKFEGWIDKITTVDGKGAAGSTPLDRALETFGGVLSELGGLGGDLLEQGFEWLSDPEFGSKMKEFVADLRSLVNDVMPLLKALFLEIAGIVDAIADDVDTIKSIGDIGKDPKDRNSSGFSDWKGGIGDRAGKAFQIAPGGGTLQLETMRIGFENLLGTINLLKLSFTNMFREVLIQAATVFPQATARIGQFLSEAGIILSGFPTVVSTIFSNLPGIVSTWVGGMATEARNGLANMVTEAIIGCAQFVAELVIGGNNAVAEVRGWPAKLTAELAILAGEFYQEGVNAVQGFIDGLGSLIEKAKTVASDLGWAAKMALKAAINSNSPSREFMKLGEFAGEGFAIGIEQTSNQAVDEVRAMAKAVFEAMKEVFGSAEGANFNFNFGAMTSAMDQVGSSAQGLQRTLSNTGLATTGSGGTGKVDATTKAEIDKIKQEMDFLDYQKQSLKVQMNQTGDKTLKQQMDALQMRKDALGLQIQELEYGAKYQQQTAGIGQQYQSIMKTASGMPFDFASASIGQFQQDLGMSGGGALGAAMGYGMDFAKNAAGSIFNFNVSNVDDAIAVKNNQINKQSVGIIPR